MKFLLFLLMAASISTSYPLNNLLNPADSLDEGYSAQDSVIYKPEIPFGNVLLQFLGGDVMGIGIALAGIAVDRSGTASIVGFTLGVTLGVHLLGSRDYKKGSMFPVFIGAAGGLAISILTLGNSSNNGELSSYSILFIPAACGIFAYYMFGTRDINSTALINMKNNNLNMSMPSLSIEMNKFKPGERSFNLEVLRVGI